MTLRLSQIDASNIAAHARLIASDTCLYVYEYTSGRNYAFSQTNSLINNLKKRPSTASPAELRYKAGAIDDCAKLFAATLNPEWLDIATLVPIPGSKAATIQTLTTGWRGFCAEFGQAWMCVSLSASAPPPWRRMRPRQANASRFRR